MRRVRRLLRWLRIEDRTGKLSLTTVAFAAAMYMLLSGKGITLDQLGTFAVAITAHRHRQAADTESALEETAAAPDVIAK